jgi:hypothetical protein
MECERENSGTSDIALDSSVRGLHIRPCLPFVGELKMYQEITSKQDYSYELKPGHQLDVLLCRCMRSGAVVTDNDFTTLKTWVF